MTIDFGTETVRKFDRLEAMSNRTVGAAKFCRDGLTGKDCSRDPVPTRCSRRQHDRDHADVFLLGDVMAVRRLRQGQDAGGDGVDFRRVVGECRDRKKSLILLRRFYTRNAAAGSKYRLVKVSPASVRGMSIGDDPTARR